MSQKRVPPFALFSALLIVLPASALVATDDAETGLHEPGERPDHLDIAIDLPEPELPASRANADGPASPTSAGTTDPAAGAREDARIASTQDVVGEVDGRPVGTLAAPAPPGAATADAGPAPSGADATNAALSDDPPLHQLPGELLEQITAGPTGPIGASVQTPSASEATVRPADAVAPRRPSIDADPERSIGPDDLDVDGRWPAVARSSDGVVADRQVIAYYGHPMSRFMGILGENAIEVMAAQLKARAAEYDAINGAIGVAPSFHIIYGTVYEDASIGILREKKLIEYIEFAREHGLEVFLDHQIGNGTVEEAIRAMLPYLRYEHVHLAIDPEWATDTPGREIGGVTAEDINLAQRLIQEYLEANGLSGTRMLVVHQFNYRMIADRENVRADYPRVQLIHHADGFGTPAQKRDSWRFNVLAANMPLKGIKLFYPKSWRDGGYDDPLMSPVDVMQLEPVPVYIQYQ
ncbi:MAG: hypothetical protein ACOC2D_19480 [Spirochaetota bacterium]